MNYLNIFTSYSRRLTSNRIRYVFKKNNFPLIYINDSTLRNTSFNIYLSNIKVYRYFYLYLDIMITYSNNKYKKALLKKKISPKNSNKYLNINLNTFLSSEDLKNLKTLSIDIYSNNIILYFAKYSISKTPFLNLQFDSKQSIYDNPPVLTPTKPVDKCTSSYVNNYLPPYNEVLNEIPNNNYLIPNDNTSLKSRTIDKLIHKCEEKSFYHLLLKMINKYIKLKIEFNGTKLLQGILMKVTPNTVILKDNQYNHVICTDSISIIEVYENIDVDNLVNNSPSSYILKALKYLKNNNINIEINDKYLNISTVRIVNCCNSFLQAEDIKSKKNYFFNSKHIKTIEYIPISKKNS